MSYFQQCFGMIGPIVMLATLIDTVSGQPVGPANVPQIQPTFVSTATALGTGTPQRTFLTTDPISLAALYYDPSDTCTGERPTSTQLFLFSLEGLLISGNTAVSIPITFEGVADKYHVLNMAFGPGALPANQYRFIFVVADCTNTRTVISPEFVTIRVFNP